jgi:hypothetical protein
MTETHPLLPRPFPLAIAQIRGEGRRRRMESAVPDDEGMREVVKGAMRALRR